MTKLGFLAALAVVPASPAAAQSASTASAPDSRVEAERDRVRLTLSGQVNGALLYAHQGGQDQAFVIDNDASGSRFGILAEADLGDWTTGVDVVVSAEVNSSDEVDFGERLAAVDDNSVLGDFRQAHWFIEHASIGRLSVGQGDTAAEDTAHADLSGTDFAGSGSDVDDIAGGLVFDADDGTDLAELDDFFDMQDGNRAVRVLYETPEFAGGLSFSASLDDGEDSAGDAPRPAFGVAYGRGFDNGVELAAEASWRRDGEDTFIVGSASVLLPSGWNLAVAGSRGDLAGVEETTTAVFAKVGYITELLEIGETRFSFDVFRGRDAPDLADPNGDLPTATSYGLFAVQELAERNTEFYVGARLYQLDDVWVDGEEKAVDELTAVVAGARIRF